MENRALLVVYLVAWLLYVAGIHGYARWRRLDHARVALSHAMPSLVAVVMTFIFLIGHGATVRQFVASSERGMELWSLWVGLWPALLLGTFGAGVAEAVGTVIVSWKRESRAWIPVASTGAAMCGFAFLTVARNFPDA